ncbi:MAG: Zn-dependent hydrolase [Bacteroidetes bacterium GWA2_32_17]|nr:MAG: Zn-dependent hydrolase [Bacteroidetes bacterium GWA2_32_17]
MRLLNITGIFILSSLSYSYSQNNTDLMKNKVNEYAVVKLTANISNLSESEKQILPILFEAAQLMDELYWIQACPNKEELLANIKDENTRKFFMINYGPWEHLNNNKPFVEGVGNKPDGSNFYPLNMEKEEFEKFSSSDKTSWYTIISRNEKGELITIPYSKFYNEKLIKASELLKKAAEISDNESLKKYLKLRADALLSNNYFESDMAWMNLENNNIDFVIGPIESYNDGIYGYKTSFESFILLKDNEWSNKLSKFAVLLPEIQKSLPVDEKYKTEVPGKDSQLGVYEAICYAGDCNAGSKTIAINLPNDKNVNEQKGTRKLQLKNSIKAKFDKILLPMSEILIDDSQTKNIKFDAFFENIMFHEVAHGLGVSKTINNKGTVSDALKDLHTSLEECKADILGLYIVTYLNKNGKLNEHELIDNYVTFLAGIFRSVRFGAASSHGKANMIEFNYFEKNEAFTRDVKTGKYKMNFEKMIEAVSSLGKSLLTIQGNGDYEGGKKILTEMGIMKPQLEQDLQKVSNANIPRDIIFEQGDKVLGLSK